MNSPTELAKVLISGGERAIKEYRRLSGVEWFSWAPEYFLTCYAAAAISACKGTWVCLEADLVETLQDARAKRPGRPRKLDRRKGRYDIVVYHQNGLPKAAVEVKSKLWCADRARIWPDLDRLCAALSASNKSTFRFCTFLYYIGVGKPERRHQSSIDRVGEAINSVEALAEEAAKDRKVNVFHTRGEPHSSTEGDGAYAIATSTFIRFGSRKT